MLVELGYFLYEAYLRFRYRDLEALEIRTLKARDAFERGQPRRAYRYLQENTYSVVVSRFLFDLIRNYQTQRLPEKPLKLLQEYEFLTIKRLERTRILVRVGPLLGLMGTLIPLAPALQALADGDTQKLADNLTVAFSITVLGLLIGGIAFVDQHHARPLLLAGHLRPRVPARAARRQRRTAARRQAAAPQGRVRAVRRRPRRRGGDGRDPPGAPGAPPDEPAATAPGATGRRRRRPDAGERRRRSWRPLPCVPGFGAAATRRRDARRRRPRRVAHSGDRRATAHDAVADRAGAGRSTRPIRPAHRPSLATGADDRRPGATAAP